MLKHIDRLLLIVGSTNLAILTVTECVGDASDRANIQCAWQKHVLYVSYLHLLTPSFLPSQDSLCSPQLIMEDEGLRRLAQTVQVLANLLDGSQRALKLETSGTTSSTEC